MSKRVLPDYYQMVKLSDYPAAYHELRLLFPWRHLLTNEAIKATQLYKLIQHATHLDVSTNKGYGAAVVASVIAAITSINTIKINGYSIDFDFCEALTNLARSGYIRTVDLSNIKLGHDSDWIQILTPYVELKPNLHTLIMKSNCPALQLPPLVAKLLHLPSLTMLDLSYNNLNECTGKQDVIYKQKKMETLEIIEIHNSKLIQDDFHIAYNMIDPSESHDLCIIGKCA